MPEPIELAPCPFCGSADVEPTESDRGCPIVTCLNCGADGPPYRDYVPHESEESEKAKAAGLWNRRHHPPVTIRRATREEVRAMRDGLNEELAGLSPPAA